MIPRATQRWGGILIALFSGGFTAWEWYTLLHRGYFYDQPSVVFPAFLILGLGLILFPGYKEERLARGEDISELTGMQLLTPRWWGILVCALVAGFGNFLLMRTL